MKLKNGLTAFFLLFFTGFLGAYTEEEKATIVEKVYQKVCNALGSAEEKPKFIFDRTKSMQIAYMSKDKDGAPIIGFESKAFDVCAKFGNRMEDAIAFIIGHELSHFYLNHHWGEDFKSTYSLGALEKEIRDIDRAGVKRFETQADERGGILCYLAGYGISGIGETLLTELYTAYQIPVEASVKYPSLEDRIAISKAQDSLVQTYIRIYETGNFAMMMEEYDLAIKCYESITAAKFNSASIFNNLGMAYFYKAVALDELNPMKYYYPMELDVLLTAKGSHSKGMGDPDPEKYYDLAIQKFEKAIAFDPNNLSAYLNRICVYSHREDQNTAGFHLRNLAKHKLLKSNNYTYSNFQIIEAIVIHQEGKTEEALERLGQLEKRGSELAKINRAMIENGAELSDVTQQVPPLGWSKTDSEISSAPEKIKEFTNYSLQELDRIFKPVQNLSIGKDAEVAIGQEIDHRVYVFSSSENSVYVFHTTLPGYKGKTALGLQVGSTAKDLENKYGAPESLVSSNAGTYYLYGKKRIGFLLNEKNEIASWVLIRNLR